MSVDYLTADAIDVQRLLAEVAGEGRGGTVLFLGSVRRSAEDGPVRAIDYSAYGDMAAAELSKIMQEATEHWSDARLAAQHRVGRVPAGEPSLAVVAAAPHRAEAFDACRYVVEQSKRRLPIWKKELFEDGSQRWREHITDQAPESDVRRQ